MIRMGVRLSRVTDVRQKGSKDRATGGMVSRGDLKVEFILVNNFELGPAVSALSLFLVCSTQDYPTLVSKLGRGPQLLAEILRSDPRINLSPETFSRFRRPHGRPLG